MNFKCMNSKYRHIAELQGQANYSNWPINPYSGSTGGHPGYPWRLDHLLSEDFVKDVIQCFASRPLFYNNSLWRQSGYLNGSRPQTFDPQGKPVKWVPADDGNLPGDLPTGEWQNKDGIKVSGPDLIHIPLSALFAVAKSFGYKVKTDDGDVPAQKMAMELLKYTGHAHAGMYRTIKGPAEYVGSDRGVRYVFETLLNGIKLGFLEPVDLELLALHVVDHILPAWADKKKFPYGSDTRVYNGLHWVLPPLYEAWLIAPPDYSIVLFEPLVAKAKCCLQLAELVPGKSCYVADVKLWGPDLTVDGITLGGTYIGPWGIRSMLCAAEILKDIDPEGAALCQKEGMDEFAKWVGKPEGPNKVSWKGWAVDPLGNYLW